MKCGLRNSIYRKVHPIDDENSTAIDHDWDICREFFPDKRNRHAEVWSDFDRLEKIENKSSLKSFFGEALQFYSTQLQHHAQRKLTCILFQEMYKL